jgi:hypothetical protein
MMATLSQAKNTREHGNGWQRILGGPVSGKAASTGSAVIEAILPPNAYVERGFTITVT